MADAKVNQHPGNDALCYLITHYAYAPKMDIKTYLPAVDNFEDNLCGDCASLGLNQIQTLLYSRIFLFLYIFINWLWAFG
mgnify:CR=1 FL=1